LGIVVTDSSQVQTICSKIGCCQKKIVWMLRNQEGNYKLEFTASQDAKKPTQDLDLPNHLQEHIQLVLML